MMKGVLGGVCLAILYRLTLQPHVATSAELILSIAPFIALGGLVRASRRTAVAGIDFNMCFLLASQAVLPAPPASAIVIFEQSSALVLAAAIVTTGFRLMPRRADRRAEAIASLIRRDLHRVATAQLPSDMHRATPARVLRLMLHLSRAANLGDRAPGGLLATLNLGNAITGLQRQQAREDLDIVTMRTLDEALAALQDLSDDPLGVADQLEQHAALTRDRPAATVLHDTAVALRQSACLLTFSEGARSKLPGLPAA
jgi:hypothetical protein